MRPFSTLWSIAQQVLANIVEGKAALLDWVSSMTQLTHVDIQRVDINEHDLARLAQLKGLKHLGVGDLSMDKVDAGIIDMFHACMGMLSVWQGYVSSCKGLCSWYEVCGVDMPVQRLHVAKFVWSPCACIRGTLQQGSRQ